MLTRLSIRDFVIVDVLELEFAAGFTVLSGETGAGKSILIDALTLTLGERADAGVVLAGKERAEVTAEFDLSGLPAVTKWVQHNQLEGDEGMLQLRRTVDVGGRSRAFINGRAATVQQQKEVGEQLVDVHGQHAHQSLLKRDVQRALLDDFGGLIGLANATAENYQAWQQLRERRRQCARDAEASGAEREELLWQTRELTGVACELDAWQETLAEHGRLANAASLIEAAEAGLALLADSQEAIIGSVSSLEAKLRQLAAVDVRLTEITAMLEPARIHLQESAYGLRHYRQRIDLDPARLAEVERRIAEVQATARKYRVAPENLPALLSAKETRLAELTAIGGEALLMAQETAAEAEFSRTANLLSAGRKKAAAALSRQVTTNMESLAMPGGQFQVLLTPLAEAGAHGLEQIEFQVAAHAGQPLGPLVKVASGGELSRISLAVQVVLSRIAAVPTLIFDEVDAGIGGRVAEIVGQLLQQLGKTRQVMCVTHLPQVAACGTQHWRVTKNAIAGAARSQIEVLQGRERIEELARMLGGVKITETARKHAREMLGAKQ